MLRKLTAAACIVALVAVVARLVRDDGSRAAPALSASEQAAELALGEPQLAAPAPLQAERVVSETAT